MMFLGRLLFTALYGGLMLVALFFALGFGAFSGSPLGCGISLVVAALFAWRAWAAWSAPDESPQPQPGYYAQPPQGGVPPEYAAYAEYYDPSAAWGTNEAPTDKQMRFLYHLGFSGKVQTKAEASNVIDAILKARGGR